MDWQQPVALGVVAITAVAMLMGVVRRRRQAAKLGGSVCAGCGCAGRMGVGGNKEMGIRWKSPGDVPGSRGVGLAGGRGRNVRKNAQGAT